MRKLRNFAGISDFFSDREIDEILAAIDARREAHTARGDASQDGSPTRAAAGPRIPEGGRRAS